MFNDKCKLVKIIGMDDGNIIFVRWENGVKWSILFMFIRLLLILDILMVVLISVGYK